MEGAVLTCTNSTREIREIWDKVRGKKIRWGVEKMPSERGPDSMKMYRKLDNPEEEEKLMRYHDEMDGVMMREEGTCPQLMKLESEWENYIIDEIYKSDVL